MFDDEEEWEQEVRLACKRLAHRVLRLRLITVGSPPLQGTTIQAGLGPIFSTALRGVTAISERLTEAAVQVAPADTSPAVVRVAVNAGLVLLSLSFVKSLLSVSFVHPAAAACCFRGTAAPRAQLLSSTHVSLPIPGPCCTLQFFLTLGTIILGAYVAVKVFGMDVAGIAAVGSGDSSQSESCGWPLVPA